MSKETKDIEWLCFPETEKFILNLLDKFSAKLEEVKTLKDALLSKTATRLMDWIDHLVVAGGKDIQEKLMSLGYEQANVSLSVEENVYHHLQAIFPKIQLKNGASSSSGEPLAAGIKVDSISDFLMSHKLHAEIQGTPFSPYRRALAWKNKDAECFIVERRGHKGVSPVAMPSDYLEKYTRAYDAWSCRRRYYDDVQVGMNDTMNLVRNLVREMGANTAAWIVFEVERNYWQKHNPAGRLQKQRQDRLGLGWANHDHHTFRSSRRVFQILIQILETLGFLPRERFYAGREAGWGAQVMEHPNCGLVVFADVDLAPDEVDTDFSHDPLKFRPELGTIGYWCALHGESILNAGLHHLAVRLQFVEAKKQFEKSGVKMMKPFSNLPHLNQAFTLGEMWTLPEKRLQRLVLEEVVKKGQKKMVQKEGALGSHLENIQRGEGFKGFSQKNVSDIIRRTDPRK